jgi:MFS family permease
MIEVLRNSWALLLGVMLLLMGNGIQGTLLGIRGGIEGYDAATMSLVMSAYFMGFLAGSTYAPRMIQRVGHVRVFAALGSLISAAFILYAAAPQPWVWIVMRLIVGFSFSGVYVVSESWLNDASSNENRGKSLSLYMIVQMLGIISGQLMLNFADPAGYTLFVVMSVLVSVSFMPILLSAGTAPAFNETKKMTLARLYGTSPLGFVGTFLLGGVFAGIFGMSAVYGTEKGLSVGQISIFVATIYAGGLFLQYPIGLASDRMDRRKLILGVTTVGAALTLGGAAFVDTYLVLLGLGFVIGAVANPLYSLMIAYTNDYLEQSDMAAASGGLMFINGCGAVTGPVAIGWMMTAFGADAFFVFLGLLFSAIGIYAVYRMRRRPVVGAVEATPFVPVTMSASVVSVEAAQEAAIEAAQDGTAR